MNLRGNLRISFAGLSDRFNIHFLLVLYLFFIVLMAVACGDSSSNAGKAGFGSDGDQELTDMELGGACNDDEECPAGQVCEDDHCIDSGTTSDGDQETDKAVVDPGRIRIPQKVEFGAVSYGQLLDKSAVIENIGDGPLRIFTIKLEGSSSLDFAIINGDVDEQGKISNITLQKGETYEIFIRYIPSDAGKDEGTLEINSNDDSNPNALVPLISDYKGTPDIKVEPAEIAFPDTAVGTKPLRGSFF